MTPAPSHKATAGRPSVRAIQDAVAEAFGISRLELISDRRTKRLFEPRHIAMFLAKELTGQSYADLGRRFGGRDHTSVIHGVRRGRAMLDSSPDLRIVCMAVLARFLPAPRPTLSVVPRGLLMRRCTGPAHFAAVAFTTRDPQARYCPDCRAALHAAGART